MDTPKAGKTGHSGSFGMAKPTVREAAETRVGWRMAGIGMQVTSEVAGGLLLGWLFDRWRGHGTIGVIVGSVAGICVALWSLIRQTLKLSKELDRQHPTANQGAPIPPDEPFKDWKDDDNDQGPSARS
jgi:F0F1-type ATP synthase assembly protein I